jgi:hypothetical protein
MFEHRRQPLVSRSEYLRRVGRFAIVSFVMVAGALLIGILGYHGFEGMSWLDALLNAAMILGGMGQVNELHTDAGKLFASFYALFSGIVFLVSVGVLAAPTVHRLFHQFHLDVDQDDDESDS